MTTLQDLRQTLSHFADGRRKRRQLRREFAQLAAMGSLDAVLADVGLVRSQIAPLVAGCADSGELLDQMLARVGIDPARLPVEGLRDMTWTCTTCPDKRKCREWLSGARRSAGGRKVSAETGQRGRVGDARLADDDFTARDQPGVRRQSFTVALDGAEV